MHHFAHPRGCGHAHQIRAQRRKTAEHAPAHQFSPGLIHPRIDGDIRFHERLRDGREFGGGSRGARCAHRHASDLARKQPHNFIRIATALRPQDQGTHVANHGVILLFTGSKFPLAKQLILALEHFATGHRLIIRVIQQMQDAVNPQKPQLARQGMF